MKKSVVLYPGVGVSHLVPMVALANALLRHGNGEIAVTVALVEPPADAAVFSTAVAGASHSNPRVAFHVLQLPPPAADSTANHIVRRSQFLADMNVPLRDLLRSLPAVRALVIGMFCTGALDVAAELGLPVYYLYVSAASDLAVFLSVPAVLAGGTVRDLGDALVSLPGVPPFRASEFRA